MNESAFGIDHGDIAKGMATNNAAWKIHTAVTKAPGVLKKVPGKVVNTKVSIKDVGQATGRGISSVGMGINRHPGATGAGVVGGGSYALWRSGRNEDLRGRKKKVSG